MNTRASIPPAEVAVVAAASLLDETDVMLTDPHKHTKNNDHDDGTPLTITVSSRFYDHAAVFTLPSRWKKFLVMLVVAGSVLLFHDAEVAEDSENTPQGWKTLKDMTTTSNISIINTSTAANDIDNLLSRQQQAAAIAHLRSHRATVETERDKLFERLQRAYGPETFQASFQYTHENGQVLSLGKFLFTSPHGTKSLFRLKRKFIAKLLQATKAQYYDNNNNNNKDTSTNRQPHNKNKYFAQFIWANGGHSSSAGHGNFFWESFTAVMERNLIPFFAAMGVEFVARNYAMGGTTSGEEVALCLESIFGRDVDVVTWDYGMTDSGHHDHWKQLMYTYQTARLPHRPVAIGLDFVSDKTRIKIYAELEVLGMATLYQNHTFFNRVKNGIPDTQLLLGGDAAIEQMPPMVKRFKCGGAFEKGDPGCRDEKYNMMDCIHRKGQTSWHPGWKMHALIGNALSLFLVEILLEAAEELEVLSEHEDVQDLLDQLLVDEEEAYNNLLSSPIPDKLSPIANWIFGGKDDDHEKPFGNVNLRDMYKKRSFCHTALLPAEIRYKGLLTARDGDDSDNNYDNNGNTISTSATSPSSYDIGIPQPQPTDAVPENKGGGQMRLAYDPKVRNTECDYSTGIDYKDFFFLSSVEGWRSLTIPNDAEQKYYKLDTSQMIGMILMCLTGCDWNQCGDGDWRDQFDDGSLKLLVNGVPVIEYTKVGICWALKNEENIYQWTPNAKGKFEIKARLDIPGGEFAFVRFSSFIFV